MVLLSQSLLSCGGLSQPDSLLFESHLHLLDSYAHQLPPRPRLPLSHSRGSQEKVCAEGSRASPHRGRRRLKKTFNDRACHDCHTQHTSQWRTGPAGSSTYPCPPLPLSPTPFVRAGLQPTSGLSTHHRSYFLSSPFPHRLCNACGSRYARHQRNRRKGLGGTAADNYSSPEAAQVPQPQGEYVERSCHAAPPDAPRRSSVYALLN